nr:MAG TPA: hypothetical protein [Caudoviricetes sp.]
MLDDTLIVIVLYELRKVFKIILDGLQTGRYSYHNETN